MSSLFKSFKVSYHGNRLSCQNRNYNDCLKAKHGRYFLYYKMYIMLLLISFYAIGLFNKSAYTISNINYCFDLVPVICDIFTFCSLNLEQSISLDIILYQIVVDFYLYIINIKYNLMYISYPFCVIRNYILKRSIFH